MPFQVIQETVYLSDDSNTAVFPQENGVFDIEPVAGRHYQVNGDSSTPQPPAATYTATAQQTTSTPQGRFLFASRQTAPTPTFRRQTIRTFPR